MRFCINKEMASTVAVLIMLCAFALFAGQAKAEENPGKPFDKLAISIANVCTSLATDPRCSEGERFIDKGLTVYDCDTNLEWEKKTAANVDDTFTWSQGPPWNFDGTAADYINALNAVGFAGRKDWRLPMVVGPLSGGTAELETIVDLSQENCGGGSGACIDPIFGPIFLGAGYWSSVTFAFAAYDAFNVFFGNGDVGVDDKLIDRPVRAVRTGP